MNEDTIQDLKQFTAATVSQHVSELQAQVAGLHSDNAGIRTDISNLDNKLSKKIDDLSGAVAEAMENSNQAVGDQLDDHERRITQLERQAT